MSLLLLAVALAAAPTCPSPAEARGRVSTPALDEISGVTPGADGGLWVIEDSANPAVLAELDPTGRVLRSVAVVGAPNRDWEDLAAGPCPTGRCLYVADVGDNRGERPFVRILRVPEPPTGETRVRAEVLPFRYPEGAQNAEALTVDATGALAVYTKRGDGTARVYALEPAFGAAEPVEARLVQTLRVDIDGRGGPSSRVTGATLVGDALLLRTYEAVWAFPAGGSAWDEGGRVRLPAPSEPQGEAIAWDAARGGWWAISEAGQPATVPPMWFTPCTP